MSDSIVARLRGAAAVPLGRRLAAEVGVGAAVAGMILGAQVRVGWPVPFTFQTFFVLLSGALLGRRWGPAAQLGYLLLGGVGVPVFAGGALFGATFGYLVGFVAAAWLIGEILSRSDDPGLARGAAAMAAGSAVILLPGMAHLAWGVGLGPARAFEVGLWPFLAGDGLKLAMALAVWRRFGRRARALFGR